MAPQRASQITEERNLALGGPFLSGLGIVTPKKRFSIMLWAYESFGFERQKVRGGRSVCVVRLGGNWGQRPKSLCPRKCSVPRRKSHLPALPKASKILSYSFYSSYLSTISTIAFPVSEFDTWNRSEY